MNIAPCRGPAWTAHSPLGRMSQNLKEERGEMQSVQTLSSTFKELIKREKQGDLTKSFEPRPNVASLLYFQAAM